MEKCLECGAAMTLTHENYRYERSGLPHVVLEDVAVYRCGACGNYEVEIPRLAELHRELARAFLTTTGRLRGAEVRFLRKHLGWNGVEFARYMGVEAETVSRWETGKNTMSPTADRLLRLYVATRLGVVEPTTWQVLQHAGEGEMKMRFQIRDEAGAWQAEAA